VAAPWRGSAFLVGTGGSGILGARDSNCRRALGMEPGGREGATCEGEGREGYGLLLVQTTRRRLEGRFVAFVCIVVCDSSLE
jgi:hypothetical protein